MQPRMQQERETPSQKKKKNPLPIKIDSQRRHEVKRSAVLKSAPYF